MVPETLLPFLPSSLALDVSIKRLEGDVLQLDYFLTAQKSDVVLPSQLQSGQSVRRDELWKETCFELFLSVDNGEGVQAYYEFNFSPSGDWAVYRFDGYRDGMTSPEVLSPPEIEGRWLEGQYHMSAAICVSDFEELSGKPLKAGLCAIVEEQERQISHWALCHLGEKPDFHRLDSFEHRLDPIL